MRPEIQRAIHGVAVLCVSAWAGGAIAATAVAPVYGTIGYDTYSGGPSYSRYLDISDRTCSEWNYRGMIVGAVYYKYVGGCANSCGGGTTCNNGAGNYYVVVGANGWDFNMLYLNANSSSYSKTCDRCALGLLGASGGASGPRTRTFNRKDGIRMSGWISPTLVYGQTISGGEFVGNPTL